MEYDIKPAEIKLEISINTSMIYRYVTDKTEFDDGIAACYRNERYSKDWTRSKQAGYFMGRIINVAMITEGIEKDLHSWTKEIENPDVKAPLRKMKLTPDGVPYIEEVE